jgi:oligosaccharide translocation protein RFT1
VYGWHLGDTSLVFADIVNLSARIAYAVHFVSAFFSTNSARSASVLSWGSALPEGDSVLHVVYRVQYDRVRGDVPGTFARAEAGISVLMKKNSTSVGGVLGLVCLATWWFTEGRRHLALSRERAKTE